MEVMSTVIIRTSAGLALAVILLQCTSPSRPGLPPGSPFAPDNPTEAPSFKHGVAVGDVTSGSAQLWTRTTEPSTVRIEWGSEPEWQTPSAEDGPTGTKSIRTDAQRDLTATVSLDGLSPATRYRYRMQIVQEGSPSGKNEAAGASLSGHFLTAPAADAHQHVRLVWSSDLGGQGRCREPEKGYRIFDAMRDAQPSFAVLLGDVIYGDDSCATPENVPGSELVASTLDEFRSKHRYQREDKALQRFLASVPVYATWDDHEVRNNFSGVDEPLMPIGRRALLEYWPIRTPPEEPQRLYRRVRYGADLELFILDTRQYRSPNSEPDGPGKTMLGQAQREWLRDGLSRSTATWKVIASSVPLSIRKGGSFVSPANDNWARGAYGTGFYTELKLIVDTILDRGVHNVIWLVGDVHYAQVNEYDPDADGVADFHEAISGPLSAGTRAPDRPQPDLRPTTAYSEGGFFNFGVLTVDRSSATVEIRDDTGRVRFRKAVRAR